MTTQNFGKQFILLLVTAGLAMASCKKEKETGENPPVQNKKLVKLEQNATNYSTFDYNNDGTLKKFTSVEDEGGSAETTVINYTYNAQKKISEADLNGEVQLKYHYSGNQIDKLEYYADDLLALYSTFEYSNNRLTKMTRYTNTGEPGPNEFMLSGKSECSYFANGNIKEIKEYSLLPNGTLGLAFTRQFAEYDNKINPFKPLSEPNIGLILNYASDNNLLKEKLLDGDGTTELESTYTYTYDPAGYPLTAVNATTSGGEVTTTTVRYIYQ